MLTSSAETEYAIVCPSAMRVISAVLNVARVQSGVRREFPPNGGFSATDATFLPTTFSIAAVYARLKQSEPGKPESDLAQSKVSRLPISPTLVAQHVTL
jgi:hypothetical protein